ncbi:hypothetical protein ECZU51_41050 [Escherichia coli]|nr:hypothetical protein ECZU51_41050 [Escherichia coli]
MVAVKWVLIKFYNAADGVTESFRRDGAPVGATAANILITLDNCDARTLLNPLQRLRRRGRNLLLWHRNRRNVAW